MTLRGEPSPPLSDREIDVLLSYARTGSLKEMAYDLGLRPATVRGYWTTLRRKLGTSTAIETFRAAGLLVIPTTGEARALRLRQKLELLRSEVDALLARFRLTWRTA
jgi:DNA-binding CsgD family transcriptional regulator